MNVLEIIRKKVSRSKTLSYSHNESNQKSNSLPLMDRPNQPNAPNPGEYYSWRPEGHAVDISLHFEIIDKLLIEIMKGFGSIPRRGAEVGGLLLGTSETTDGKLHITIRDFQPVACEHSGGPSYSLSVKDIQGLKSGIEQLRPTGSLDALHVVGHYRSHTREGLGMSDEDIDLMDDHLPGDDKVMLLVKPFATRTSSAGFFFRESSEFLRTDASYLEFPFKRKDLGGGSSGTERIAAAARFGESRPPAENPLQFPSAPRPSSRPVMEAETMSYADPEPAPQRRTVQPEAEFSSDPEPSQLFRPRRESRLRGGWVWIPLSLIFLVLGVLLGFQTALSMRPNGPAALGPEIFNLALTVIKSGDSLNVTWDRQATAVRTAGHGVLYIKDGDFNKALNLDATELQVGSVVYRKPSTSVTFKLEVFPRDRTVVSESVEYKEAP